MKHAILLAHPKPDSFCAAIARTAHETLTALGEEVALRDLYAIDFDPRLRADEIPTHDGARARPDVLAERDILSGADSVIFIYPFWFNAPPAILKGYVDRVLGMGFGYDPRRGGPLLGGKSLISISTSGAPEHWVKGTGALQALMTLFDDHLSGVCGLRVLDHVHLGGVVSNITEEAAQDMLERVRERLRGAFAPAEARL
jgi:NAD(P)H dehydrogenase (quinone)